MIHLALLKVQAQQISSFQFPSNIPSSQMNPALVRPTLIYWRNSNFPALWIKRDKKITFH